MCSNIQIKHYNKLIYLRCWQPCMVVVPTVNLLNISFVFVFVWVICCSGAPPTGQKSEQRASRMRRDPLGSFRNA